jgi:hypothetical protein
MSNLNIKTRISKDDPFLTKYLEIYEKTLNEPESFKINFGIFRNDFMIDQLKQFIYQIEINTIACAGAYFTDGLKKFFSHFTKKYPEYFEKYLQVENCVPIDDGSIVDSCAKNMYKAISLNHNDPKETIVVFVIQEGERNEYEQRAIEFQLWDLL